MSHLQARENIIEKKYLFENIDNISVALGLFVLTISSNYISELLGCKNSKLTYK